MIDLSNIAFCAGSCALPLPDSSFNTTVQEYVEIIRDLTTDRQVARVKEIAEKRGVTRSSVSSALVMLRDLGLVEHEHYGYVALTPTGRDLGDSLERRHKAIFSFLHNVLNLDEDTADQEACKLEHQLGKPTLDALAAYVAKIGCCPWCNRIKLSDVSESADVQ